MTSPRLVALCTGAATFSDNQILRCEVARKCPDVLSVPQLSDQLLRHGITMVTGDVALRRVLAEEAHQSDVWVIEEFAERFAVVEQLVMLWRRLL